MQPHVMAVATGLPLQDCQQLLDQLTEQGFLKKYWEGYHRHEDVPTLACNEPMLYAGTNIYCQECDEYLKTEDMRWEPAWRILKKPTFKEE